jgi:curved DNA-binding protein CbpA
LTTDYYHLLSVAPDSTEREIKLAYRRMAEVYHPDKLRELPPAVRKEGEEIMRLLNEAKSVLLDPANRREYDRFRSGASRPPTEAIIVGEDPGAADFTDFVIDEGSPELEGKMKRVLTSMKEVFVRDRSFQRKIAEAEEIVEAQVIEDAPSHASKADQTQEMTLEFSVVSKKPMPRPAEEKPPEGKRNKFRILAVEDGEEDDGSKGG